MQTVCLNYARCVPRPWDETIDARRQEVRDAILQATSELVAQHGLHALTMSQIAEGAGIGRATLYRYFGDIEAVLAAWHHDQITEHLTQLVAVRDGAKPAERLAAVLETYAALSLRSHGHHDAAAEAVLHRDHQLQHARDKVRALVSEVIADDARAGRVRSDTPPGELAAYCIHAVSAAAELTSQASVRRLLAVTLAGLRADRRERSGRRHAD